MAKQDQGKKQKRPGRGKAERYLQPSLLLALREREAYGYELIRTIGEFGFIQGDAPPGMVYRHLRQLEEEELVTSSWDTQESGPAKRVYHLAPAGEEVLEAWVDYMRLQAEKLERFIERYKELAS
mgnify:CR=1 FL=1